GYMAGFMMQKGVLVICGNAGDALGDSLYEGRIYVAGQIASLGNDAVVEEVGAEDEAVLREALECGMRSRVPSGRCGIGEGHGGNEDGPHAAFRIPHSAFQRVTSARRLYHFDRREFARWREA